jgi:hypothetical protein
MNRPSWTDPSNYRPSCWLLFTKSDRALDRMGAPWVDVSAWVGDVT